MTIQIFNTGETAYVQQGAPSGSRYVLNHIKYDSGYPPCVLKYLDRPHGDQTGRASGVLRSGLVMALPSFGLVEDTRCEELFCNPH